MPNVPCLAAVLLLAIVRPAAARAECAWSDLDRDDAHAAAIRPAIGAGTTRVHFVADRELRTDCPSAGAACRHPAYLVAGDIVLAGRREGAFTCAAFLRAHGAETVAFLPTAALAPLPPGLQRAGDWVGRWTAPERDIAIAATAKGALKIDGIATWGVRDPRRRANGGINTGDVAGTARPVGGVLAFTQGDDGTLPYGAGEPFDCRIRMIRRGPYLLARDDGNCGGVNVSFSGLYRRR